MSENKNLPDNVDNISLVLSSPVYKIVKENNLACQCCDAHI